MPYSDNVAERIRERLSTLPNVIEKVMMGGFTFMYNDKMCVGVIKDELMCRIDPELHENCVEKYGCRTMDFTNRPMIGHILIDEYGMQSQQDFNFWIDLAIDFNSRVKSSKK